MTSIKELQAIAVLNKHFKKQLTAEVIALAAKILKAISEAPRVSK